MNLNRLLTPLRGVQPTKRYNLDPPVHFDPLYHQRKLIQMGSYNAARRTIAKTNDEVALRIGLVLIPQLRNIPGNDLPNGSLPTRRPGRGNKVTQNIKWIHGLCLRG